MSVFFKTEAALRNLAANSSFESGSHRAMELEAAGVGVPIGSVDYDEFEHLPADIDPFDFVGEMFTGKKQVPEVKPFKPLDINIVVHHDSELVHADQNVEGRNALTDLAAGRLVLARNLQKAISGARPGMYDRVHTYLIGDTMPKTPDRGVIIKGTENPLAAANATAQICRKGLTYVIGGFHRLPLDKVEKPNFKRTIAIFAEHQIDRGLLDDGQIWSTGHPQMPDVDTSDAVQLSRWNTYLGTLHKKRVERLEGWGLTVAEAVFNPELAPLYMDVAAVDLSVAQATTAIGKKR